MSEKILFVDDEPQILDGYKRMLYRDFAVDIAVGGELGLAMIHDCGPYAVVISDMRMPGMNGAQFLAQVRAKVPDTVRMLLTGYTDLDGAIAAINEGNILRFLTKPCDKETLIDAISFGLAQYRSVTAEKKLVKKAQIIERSTSDLETADICQWDNFEGPTGLGGPSQAKAYLVPLVGVDLHCYVVLLKITLLATIEQRYGEEAGDDFINFSAQALINALRSDDRLFHWGRDVLLATVRRHISLAGMRLEVERLTLSSRSHVMKINGSSVMIACPITFDLLPVSQFSTFEDMLVAFNAILTEKI
jgi:FixJ family two-component response regulator